MSEMRNLLIVNEDKCLTYEKDSNQIEEVKCWNTDFKKCKEGTFVYLKKTRNDLSGVNEFDDEDMFLQVKKEEDSEESEDLEELTEN